MTCKYCNGEGKTQNPVYKKEYDRLFDQGQFDSLTIHRRALSKAGSEFIPCPYCSKDDVD